MPGPSHGRDRVPVSVQIENPPTAASVWRAMTGTPIDDGLLEWPPDAFALAAVVLARSEAYRFALSPPGGRAWPPDVGAPWAEAVAEAGRRWSIWAEDREGPLPDVVAGEWELFREAEDLPMDDVSEARAWRSCQALLTLHAIADEACAGLGVALTSSFGDGSVYRARGRELLARTGTMSRIPPSMLRVLPKIRTAPNSSSSRALSRYASVHPPGVEAHWHKILGRRPGTEPRAQGTNFLLLPWPLRVRESDFRPIEGSIRSPEKEPFGLFEFVPAEGLDLDLVDRTIAAAKDEVEDVQVVCLPEAAVDERELDALEALLAAHGIAGLVTGVRSRPQEPGELPGNWVHTANWAYDHWVHIRQNKHHRWSLDEPQIYQYHLGGALHPHVRWWEAIEVPRRAIQFIEVASGVTLTTLVCEDLAQIDDVADMLRGVGPTIVLTPLLDGPQLNSRWAARYASVLADDPGSAVLTLTSYGMATRSRPHGRDASPVVALWKDPVRGTREIPLEPGAHGILLTASADLTTRRSGDGRRPVDNCTEFFDVGVFQVRAADAPAGARAPAPATRGEPPLTGEDLTVLTCWAEGVAEAVAVAREHVESLLEELQPGAAWRDALAIVQPSAELAGALDALRALARSAPLSLSELLAATHEAAPYETGLEGLARKVLQSALEQRRTRQVMEADIRVLRGRRRA